MWRMSASITYSSSSLWHCHQLTRGFLKKKQNSLIEDSVIASVSVSSVITNYQVSKHSKSNSVNNNEKKLLMEADGW